MYMCANGIGFVSVSMVVLIAFWKCSDGVVFVLFHFRGTV